jgi:hypothetical protein
VFDDPTSGGTVAWAPRERPLSHCRCGASEPMTNRGANTLRVETATFMGPGHLSELTTMPLRARPGDGQASAPESVGRRPDPAQPWRAGRRQQPGAGHGHKVILP